MTVRGSAALRVGYVMTHYPRLAQTFIAGEIDSVAAAGVEVIPFAMNRPDAHERTRPGAPEREGATTYLKDRPLGAIGDTLALVARHPLAMAGIARDALRSAGGDGRRAARRLAHFVQAARLARAARRQGLRHLHAHFGLAPASIAWFASRMASLGGERVGFSFTIHGFHDFADPAETRLDLKARAADAVVCVSDFTRSQLCLLSDPVLWPRYHVVRCGVDLARWPFRPRARTNATPVVIAVGRLSAEKGFAVLLDAMGVLRDREVAAHLLLVGDGAERASLAAQVERLGLDGRVTFAGELPPDQVRQRLEEADIFCLPSFSEGLPVSIMESMAAGVPVVATCIAGIPELAVNKETALTVPPARADALASALETLLTEPDTAARLAQAGRARVEAQHDQMANGRAMADLLRTLAGAAPRETVRETRRVSMPVGT